MTDTNISVEKPHEILVVRTKQYGVTAEGYENADGTFIVNEGSQAVMTSINPTTDAYLCKAARKRRKELCDNGVLIEKDGFYVFTQATTFDDWNQATFALLDTAVMPHDVWRTKTGRKPRQGEPRPRISRWRFENTDWINLYDD